MAQVRMMKPATPPGQSGGKRPAPSGSTSSRRDKLASFEATRKREQRVRALRLLIICSVLAAALLAYPVVLFVQDYRARNATIDELGASIAAAGCSPVETHQATGNQEHVAEGTKVSYAESPPDSGKHYPTPAPFEKRFYTMADRPAVEALVHNLEHGYTIVWYRDTAPQQQIQTLQRIAKTFGSDTYDPADKFIAAPWSAADGSFPAAKDVVLARWTADANNPADTGKQRGVRQACSAVSGPAIKDFMATYPTAASPEPNGA